MMLTAKEQLKELFQKNPEGVKQIIEGWVATGDPINKMLATDWLYNLWSSGCIKNLDGHVINSYAVWLLGDKVYHCGHCIGRTGGFILTKVETRDEYERRKKEPNRGGDGWWDHHVGRSPAALEVLSCRQDLTLPVSPNKFDRVTKVGDCTIFDFMAPFSEKLLEQSKNRCHAGQRSATGSQSTLLPPSELRVSGLPSRRPRMDRATGRT